MVGKKPKPQQDAVPALEGPSAVEPLSAKETKRLASIEAQIERNLQGFVEVGNALAVIRTERLYRGTHGTFDAYVRERWDFQKSYAYRLIDHYAPHHPTSVRTESIDRPWGYQLGHRPHDQGDGRRQSTSQRAGGQCQDKGREVRFAHSHHDTRGRSVGRHRAKILAQGGHIKLLVLAALAQLAFFRSFDVLVASLLTRRSQTLPSSRGAYRPEDAPPIRIFHHKAPALPSLSAVTR